VSIGLPRISISFNDFNNPMCSPYLLIKITKDFETNHYFG
jgi:hypothetical protein